MNEVQGEIEVMIQRLEAEGGAQRAAGGGVAGGARAARAPRAHLAAAPINLELSENVRALEAQMRERTGMPIRLRPRRPS